MDVSDFIWNLVEQEEDDLNLMDDSMLLELQECNEQLDALEDSDIKNNGLLKKYTTSSFEMIEETSEEEEDDDTAVSSNDGDTLGYNQILTIFKQIS